MSKLDSTVQKIKDYLLREGPPNNDIRENIIDYSGGNFDDCFEYGVEYGRSDLAEEILGLISRVSDDRLEGDEVQEEPIENDTAATKKAVRGRPKKVS